MNELDGNAAGGALMDAFGTEMTDAITVCAGCHARRPVAELVVYLGPGTIVRCRSCMTLLIAVVTVRGRACVDLSGLASLERPSLDG